MKYFLLTLLFVSISVSSAFAITINPCNCKGDTSIGGACYAGVGGPAYAGPGGPAYAGPGGPCYNKAKKKAKATAPGGYAYAGPGGPCYAGPGGPCYQGPAGVSSKKKLVKMITCPMYCEPPKKNPIVDDSNLNKNNK